MVEQDRSQLHGLMDGSSRPFRLELLGTRLRDAQQNYNFSIALPPSPGRPDRRCRVGYPVMPPRSPRFPPTAVPGRCSDVSKLPRLDTLLFATP